MALTVTEVVHPNSSTTDIYIPPFRGRIVNLTFDASYLTGGEVLTAAMMGWSYVFGAITLTHPANSAGTLALPTVVKRNTAGTSLTLQPLESAGDGDPMDEAGSTNDLSAFTGMFLVLGY